jgi:hypothetical protein
MIKNERKLNMENQLYLAAKTFVVRTQIASASFLSRWVRIPLETGGYLGLSYSRALEYLDRMVQEKVVQKKQHKTGFSYIPLRKRCNWKLSTYARNEIYKQIKNKNKSDAYRMREADTLFTAIETWLKEHGTSLLSLNQDGFHKKTNYQYGAYEFTLLKGNKKVSNIKVNPRSLVEHA